jgi:hypothetical protein
MDEIHWRDPRDAEPWVVRVHFGVPPVLGQRPVPLIISFRHWEAAPALIYAVTLPGEGELLNEIGESELMVLLDSARAEGREA